MAAASSTTPTVSPSESPTPPVNEFLYKPYRKSPNKTTKRKKHLFFQVGVMPTAPPGVKAVFEVMKAVGEEAPLKNTVILPPDETGSLNQFISDNTTSDGLGFCKPRAATNTGVEGVYAKTASTKPLNILITARRQRDNLKSTQAFALVTPKTLLGTSYLYLDLLCGKSSPEIENAGAYILSFLFLVCMRSGITKIRLSSIPDRISYYQRLGFQIKHVDRLTEMEMNVPSIEPKNLLINENENAGFVENYSGAATSPREGGGGASVPAYLEKEPEESGIGIDNVFGGTGPISSNRIAAEKENMSAFMRRRRSTRRVGRA